MCEGFDITDHVATEQATGFVDERCTGFAALCTGKERKPVENDRSAASMDSCEETKRSMEMCSEVMYSASYIYKDDSRNLEELHEASVGDELAKSVDSVLCDPLYNGWHQSK